MTHWRVEATILVREILDTAAGIDAAVFNSPDPQLTLLRALERSPSPPALSELARRLKVSRQAVQQLAGTAEKMGTVTRERSALDRRIVQLDLTDFGRSQLAAVRAQQSNWLIANCYELNPREMESASETLRRIRVRIESYAAER